MITFASPLYLYLLLLLLPYIWWYFFSKQRKVPVLRFASTAAYRYIPHSWRIKCRHLPFFLRLLTLTMIIIILARPQTQTSWQTVQTSGIDIMLAMDISVSMKYTDLKPNRLEAAKQVAQAFVANRKNDNIGLTVFAGEAFTQCPLTADHNILLQQLAQLSTALPERGVIADGTAIGMGLANAVLKLKDSKAKSKVIILLTDGVNNSGEISPLSAAELAQQYGIRVYTIGVGGNGEGEIRQQLPDGSYINIPVPMAIDIPMLTDIAKTTGGVFFRASNNDKLRETYDEIDKMEKTLLKTDKHQQKYEAYMLFGWIALGLLLLDVLLRNTWLKRIP